MNPRSKPHIWFEDGTWRVMYAWLPGRRIKDFDTYGEAMRFATFVGDMLRKAGVAHG